jgi:hypothetical protein
MSVDEALCAERQRRGPQRRHHAVMESRTHRVAVALLLIGAAIYIFKFVLARAHAEGQHAKVR